MVFNYVYLPLLIFVLIVIIIFRLRKDENGNYNIDIFNILQIGIPFIKFELPFKHTFGKILLLLISFYFLTSYYLNFDFSKVFPTKLKMTVTFNDKNGIDRLIKEFNISEFNGYEIFEDSIFVSKFFEKIDKNIYSNTNFENFFFDCVVKDNNTLVIDGNAEFIVKKIDGFQKYKIDVSNGELTNKKILINQSEQSIKSEFIKIPSQFDFIGVNIKKPFSDIIMAPQFSQMIIIQDDKGIHRIPQENLFGMTKISIFPYPEFSNTLYLVKNNNKLTPIGYAVYD